IHLLEGHAMSRTLAFTLLVVLTACATDVQTTSGVDYLRRYEAAAVAAGGDSEMPDAVRQAASVEPLLTLPARFGLARIVNGGLTAIPENEEVLWSAFAARHADLGAFVSITPFTAGAAGSQRPSVQGDWSPEGRVQAVVEFIRQGAARQHVDAVLIYEVRVRTEDERTLLALADFTIIGGAILPTRYVTAYGATDALLLDVRNGYPYGTARAEVDIGSLTNMFDEYDTTRELREAVMPEAVAALILEVDRMVGELVEEIAARRVGEG
ncbi:MAG: hypothetical protein KDA49_00395, partial [Rhodospirillaceae bacterium]|nr:hypothetical protein [Rhodospirillaceae bacterium]